MDAASSADSLVSFQTTSGIDVRATVQRLGRHVVVFEVYSPAAVLHTSETLRSFEIISGERSIYSGRAVVKNVINTAGGFVVEAGLDDGWIDFELLAPGKEHLRSHFANLIERWQKAYRVRPEFKVLIADMQSLLMDLRIWSEQVELGIRAAPSADRLELERLAGEQIAPAVVKAIDNIWERFDPIVNSFETDLHGPHEAYLRRHLHPLLLCSPFAYRTYQKPLGYAGDYEMVNMIVRDPREGASLFAKLVNVWLLQQAPAKAHRNRIAYLCERLLTEALRVSNKGAKVRVLNIACGPAIELQRFLKEHDLSNRVEFSLIDFNDETLQHAGAAIAKIKSEHQRLTPVQLIRKSVHQMLKEAGKRAQRVSEQRFDFVYCAGLFDYLPDAVCKKLLSVFYDWVAPQGLLLVTNVDATQPFHRSMEYILEWHLICRSSQQVSRMIEGSLPKQEFTVKSDETGVNLFAEARKPNE
jgi:extracellular factor (EF) 3-hydroxypalmitic acid methyl ester biosynthesis protein